MSECYYASWLSRSGALSSQVDKVNLIKALSGRRRSAGRNGSSAGTEIFDQYESGMPSHQQAVNLLAGWNSAFPPPLKLNAGPLGLFADQRILWAIKRFGKLADKTILEIGPLEGMHTFMLNRERPRKIDSIEANRLNYLRCLVTSQALRLDRAHFFLGDARL